MSSASYLERWVLEEEKRAPQRAGVRLQLTEVMADMMETGGGGLGCD